MTLELEKHSITQGKIWLREGQVSAHSAHILDELGVFLLDFKHTVHEVVAHLDDTLLEVLTKDDLVLGGRELGTYGVAEESVKVPVWLLKLRVRSVVEAAREHFLGKSDEVRGCVEVPVLVCPEFTS